ncbi:hypothetical protein [Leuconostoc lactis]|uniref:hypothetical protein n=1 Tax=Leuconostoc lactis TaxID=1246 RepID=UPI0021BED9D9|nr:hypothetical protein [Leuconostoc lactis]MCT8388345.1 hypothetical protein [Leuconostoc lactis]
MTDDFGKLVTSYFKNDYRERGKVKWNGYFLSDHTSSLKVDASERHQQTERLTRMTVEDIKRTLMHALLEYHEVVIQQDVQDETGKLFKNIVGSIDGFSDRGVVIDKEHLFFEDIRGVKEVSIDDRRSY